MKDYATVSLLRQFVMFYLTIIFFKTSLKVMLYILPYKATRFIK